MYLLFAHDKLSQLPGAAQRILFRMLEEMADTVYKSNTNEHVFRKLMDELQTTMTIYRLLDQAFISRIIFTNDK